MSTAASQDDSRSWFCHAATKWSGMPDKRCTGASACIAGVGLLGSNRGSKGRQRSERESVGAAMERGVHALEWTREGAAASRTVPFGFCFHSFQISWNSQSRKTVRYTHRGG